MTVFENEYTLVAIGHLIKRIAPCIIKCPNIVVGITTLNILLDIPYLVVELALWHSWQHYEAVVFGLLVVTFGNIVQSLPCSEGQKMPMPSYHAENLDLGNIRRLVIQGKQSLDYDLQRRRLELTLNPDIVGVLTLVWFDLNKKEQVLDYVIAHGMSVKESKVRNSGLSVDSEDGVSHAAG